MSINISEIGNLAPIEPLKLSDYADTKTGRGVPRSGRFTLRAPDEIPTSAFRASQRGSLVARVDPTIVGPSHEGFPVRFVSVSATTFERDGKQVSMMGDYLRAFGDTTDYTDAQSLADAVSATAGRTYEAVLDWEANHRPTGFKVKGMRNFPKGKDGNPQPWVEHPTEKGEDGEKLRLRANLVVSKFIPATS